jgi:hypothetical protein
MTRIPFPPEPAIAADGSVLVVEHAVWVLAVPTDGSATEVVELSFEPGSVAVSAHGGYLAAAGEGQLAIVDRTAESAVAHVDLPIEEPAHLTVSDAGRALAADDGLIALVSADADVVTAELPPGAIDGLVAITDTVAFVWGAPGCSTVVFEDGAASVTPADLTTPDEALRVGERLGIRHGGVLELVDVDGGGALQVGDEVEVGDVERLAASPAGRFVLTAAVSWDGEVDHLVLERIDLETGEREPVDEGDAGPDDALVVDDDGTPMAVHGLSRPMRVVARRLGGDERAVEVDLDAIIDDLV